MLQGEVRRGREWEAWELAGERCVMQDAAGREGGVGGGESAYLCLCLTSGKSQPQFVQS